jgi:hypothetical protein
MVDLVKQKMKHGYFKMGFLNAGFASAMWSGWRSGCEARLDEAYAESRPTDREPRNVATRKGDAQNDNILIDALCAKLN